MIWWAQILVSVLAIGYFGHRYSTLPTEGAAFGMTVAGIALIYGVIRRRNSRRVAQLNDWTQITSSVPGLRHVHEGTQVEPSMTGGSMRLSRWVAKPLYESEKFRGRLYGTMIFQLVSRNKSFEQVGVFVLWEKPVAEAFQGVASSNQRTLSMAWILSSGFFYGMITISHYRTIRGPTLFDTIVYVFAIPVGLGILTYAVALSSPRARRIVENVRRVFGVSQALLDAEESLIAISRQVNAPVVYAVMCENRMLSFYPSQAARRPESAVAEFLKLETQQGPNFRTNNGGTRRSR